MNVSDRNPYVGPRTFLKEEGHLFFGRDREARDLEALVASEKFILFYAQSGAGKSSLINTRLIPDLEKKLFEVLPVARVSGETVPDLEIENIYIFNLIRSLIRRETNPELLAKLTLSQFLEKLNEDENGYFYDQDLVTPIRAQPGITPWPRALIIDQFEELYSTNAEAWQKREDFFRRLARAMEKDPFLFVIIVMREDYIALLDPYAHLLPGGLRTRYYMQRLSRESAIKAVRKPVENIRPYEEGVAEKLVEDLSSIKVQKPDGSQDSEPGQYVEPVQLQVVCYSLWQNLPAEGTHITQKDLLDVGDVDEALGKYYALRIATVAREKNVKERLLRDWIEKKLIALGGIRSMVLRDPRRKSGEISDNVIQALQSDLVRIENRGGATWYELTHDRLVSPILENNKKWFDENLSPLQRQASIWNDQQRNESWLLRDQALVEVEDWANSNLDELTDLEREFLEACRKQQEELELKQKEQIESARRLRRFLAVVGVLAMLAILAAGAAFVFATQAQAANAAANNSLNIASTEKANAQAASTIAVENANSAATAQVSAELQADRALAGNLAAQADSLKSTDHALALLLSMEAYQRDKDSLLTRTNLFQSVQFAPLIRMFGFERVASVAVSQDSRLIAVASANEVTLIDAETQQTISKISGELGDVQSIAFSPLSRLLATGGCTPQGCTTNQGQITLWDISSPQQPKQLANFPAHQALVKTVAFDPRRPILASGSYDTSIILWNIADPQKVERFSAPLQGHSSFVESIAFHPNGGILVSASDDKTIIVWNVEAPSNTGAIGLPLKEHTASINSVAFRPDGKQLASAANDNSVLLWNFDPNARSLTLDKTLKGHTGFVTALAYSTDGGLLASAGFDNSIIFWDSNTGKPVGLPLHAHTNSINALAFGNLPSSDGPGKMYWLSGSNDRTVIQWSLSTYRPIGQITDATAGTPQTLVSSGQFTAGIDGQQIRLSSNTSPLTGHTGTINSLSFSPEPIDGRLLLASGSDDQSVILWDVSTDPSKASVFLKLAGFDNPIVNTYFDSTRLITVDKNGETVAWEIDPTRWLQLACDSIKSHVAVGGETWQTFLSYLAGQSNKETCIP
jgi:WD40 repeat protein